MLPLQLKSKRYGDIVVDNFCDNDFKILPTDWKFLFNVEMSDDDIENEKEQLPVLVYIAGYAVHSALKKYQCESCKMLLTVSKPLDVSCLYSIMVNIDRGGLLYPSNNVIDVFYCYLTFKKIVSSRDKEDVFLKANCQKSIFCSIANNNIESSDISLFDICENNHTNEQLLKHIIKTTANILLNNYCKMHNDTLGKSKQLRKFTTLCN